MLKITTYEEMKNYRRTLADIDPQIGETVKTIVDDVRANGDQAVIRYSRQHDKLEAENFNLLACPEEFQQAKKHVQTELSGVFAYLLETAKNIEDFHRLQKEQSYAYKQEKCLFGMMIQPVEKAGVYVPGGKGFYPSTVLMNVIPAQVAGVDEVILSTPPRPDGSVNPLVLALAAELGINKVVKAGGAQAIAGLAYGTESIPAVDKITGPGNDYVALAKRLVSGVVGIDSIAGPSEVAILADASARPEWVAIDLCAQAEHTDTNAAFFITPNQELLDKVLRELEALVPQLERSDVIRRSLEKNSFAVKVENLEEGFEILNRIAPEHAEIMVGIDDDTVLSRIRNAGAVFLGDFTPVSWGDYYAGTNHILPTNGTARFSSPLGVYDFMKKTSFLRVNPEYGQKHAEAVDAIARFEGFEAHGLAVTNRLKAKN